MTKNLSSPFSDERFRIKETKKTLKETMTERERERERERARERKRGFYV